MKILSAFLAALWLFSANEISLNEDYFMVSTTEVTNFFNQDSVSLTTEVGSTAAVQKAFNANNKVTLSGKNLSFNTADSTFAVYDFDILIKEESPRITIGPKTKQQTGKFHIDKEQKTIRFLFDSSENNSKIYRVDASSSLELILTRMTQ